MLPAAVPAAGTRGCGRREAVPLLEHARQPWGLVGALEGPCFPGTPRHITVSRACHQDSAASFAGWLPWLLGCTSYSQSDFTLT